MTHKSDMYDIRPPPPGRDAIEIGEKRRLKVEHIGSVDVEFHEYKDVRLTLTDVSYLPCLGAVHAVSRTNQGHISSKRKQFIFAGYPSPCQDSRREKEIS